MSSADWSGFHCGSETCSTPSIADIRRFSSVAAASAACWSSAVSAGAAIRTFSVVGDSRPASETIASARPESPRR